MFLSTSGSLYLKNKKLCSNFPWQSTHTEEKGKKGLRGQKQNCGVPLVYQTSEWLMKGRAMVNKRWKVKQNKVSVKVKVYEVLKGQKYNVVLKSEAWLLFCLWKHHLQGKFSLLYIKVKKKVFF